MANPAGGYQPDPLRDKFIRGARALLDRGYGSPGSVQGTRLADPDAKAMRWCLARGINPRGPDNSSAVARGGLNARDRWMRAFIRCLYEQHLWWAGDHDEPDAWRMDRRLVAYRGRALIVAVGRRVPALGVIPAGRAVSIQVTSGGRAAAFRAARRKQEQDRIYDDAGDPAGRWSDPALRDWQG